MSVSVVTMSDAEVAIVEVIGAVLGSMIETPEQRERVKANLATLRARYVEGGTAADDAGIAVLDKLRRIAPTVMPVDE
ncbi:hypothetical protein Q8W71_00315 [Methylobacterium sp. NEAU 140]|uniref:hypothetical protein n=1 Tax=Methylobacterium sp. NEAU 140 TaxID=3064945 RepID=UPI0027345562|nr:hypothetical protein [Methylobacterium sp. NEAU 140]MDP4021052.1 hypothetical protein [Methylobacterium sp. NEAU 140]